MSSQRRISFVQKTLACAFTVEAQKSETPIASILKSHILGNPSTIWPYPGFQLYGVYLRGLLSKYPNIEPYHLRIVEILEHRFRYHDRLREWGFSEDGTQLFRVHRESQL